jgi:hypothetical protein
MYDDFLKALTLMIPSIIIAVITAIITAKLTTKSFYTKRWWEKKAEIYITITKKLTLLKKYFLKCNDSLENEITLDNIELNKIMKQYDEEINILRDIGSYGSFFISKVANETLINCLDNLDNYSIGNKDKEITSEYLKGCLDILKKCIDDFINYARKDLKQNK